MKADKNRRQILWGTGQGLSEIKRMNKGDSPGAAFQRNRRGQRKEELYLASFRMNGSLPSRLGFLHSRAVVGSQISFMSLWSPPLPVYSYLTACPLPGPCVLHLWALSTLGLATHPSPRVLFSAGKGKRCWTLPRRAYV